MDLNTVLNLHIKWIHKENDGFQANLSGANLSGAILSEANLRGAELSEANLSEADLSGAHLSGTNLSWAILREANLRGAHLSGANLSGAILRGANLRGANLSGANLSGANLSEANLSGANLSEAILSETRLPFFQIPQKGELIVWKAAENGLVKLRVPADARRTGTPMGRKCRAEYAIVIETTGSIPLSGIHDPLVIYYPGATIRPDSYDPDIRMECTHGIHFFLTREEAENY